MPSPRTLATFACVVTCLLVAPARTEEPKKFKDNKPEVVAAAADGSFTLPASKCEVYGKTLEYMPEDRALGWWNSADDHAVWKISGVKPGKYELWFEWSCAPESADNTFVLVAGDKQLKGKIPSTGSWQTHKKAAFGTIELKAGASQLDLRSEGKIKEALGDFRELKLVPAK